MKALVADWMLLVGCLEAMTTASCAYERTPLALDSLDPAHDHRQIASYYVLEANALRQKAEETAEQAAAYERLFGRDSEWVTGARLLAQYYEEEAREKDRLAGRYLSSGGGRIHWGGLPQK